MSPTRLALAGLFFLALLPRLYGALTFGAELDGPGTFQLINFDEGGSCRALLGDFPYSTFMGRQVVALASVLGSPPPDWAKGGLKRPRSYCHAAPIIRLQRIYSAVLGSLTVVLVAVIGLLIWPGEPRIGFTAGALLALSNFHVAESHWATADAPQVFFIVAFMTVLTWGIASNRKRVLWLSPVFLIAAVWTKWWVFAVFSYCALLAPSRLDRRQLRVVAICLGLPLAGILLFAWDEVAEVVQRHSYLLWGNESSRFGTGYAHIGSWRRWIRNAVNIPVVHVMALGLPACLFIGVGIRAAWRDVANRRLYLVHASVLVYLGYLLLLAPVTYYRHYLQLLPTAVLLAALGLWRTRWSRSPVFLALFFLYPALLTLDSEYNFRNEPRRAFRSWLSEHEDARMYVSFYVSPPRSAKTRLFDPDAYLQHGSSYLRAADYLVLSENWYDTAFANELNGPIAWKPEWLIKTKPEYARLYRRILAGVDGNLEPITEFRLRHFMPELILHRKLYGTFPLFIGDLNVLRVKR